MTTINMIAIIQVCLSMVLTSSAIPQHRSGSQYIKVKQEFIENPDFYDEFPAVPPETVVTMSPPSDVPTSNQTPVEKSELVHATFNFSSKTIDFEWADQTKKSVKLKTINDEFCFYQGSFDDDPESAILITGCENELLAVQIQSSLYGDTLGTSTNGTIEIVQGADLTNDSIENPDNEFFSNSPKQPDNYDDYNYNEDDQYNYENYGTLMDSSNKTMKKSKRSLIENPEFYNEFPNDGLNFDLGNLPAKMELSLNVYLSHSFRNKRTRADIQQIVVHASQILNHRSLDTKFDLIPKISDLDTDMDAVSDENVYKFQEILPAHKIKKGTVHMLMVAKHGRKLGVAVAATVCGTNNRLAVGITKWNKQVANTAQTFAHEIAHSLGIYHDFKQAPTGRERKCGLEDEDGQYRPPNEGGYNNQIMNYGRPRSNTWSECSNQDFQNYYTTVYAKGAGFCLKVLKSAPTNGQYKVHCGGHTAASCDRCPQGKGEAWCNGECFWRDNRCQKKDDYSIAKSMFGPKDNFGSCPNKPWYTYKIYDKEQCCCDNGCCWDRCTKTSPSTSEKCSLRDIPEATWVYNKDLGYFQAARKASTALSCEYPEYVEDIGNGVCDKFMLTSGCQFDGGDCIYPAPDYYDDYSNYNYDYDNHNYYNYDYDNHNHYNYDTSFDVEDESPEHPPVKDYGEYGAYDEIDYHYPEEYQNNY